MSNNLSPQRSTQPTPQPAVQLYAELLVNIRQVSVSASFAGKLDAQQVKAQVLQDGLTLRIAERDSIVDLTLPGRVAVPANGSHLPLQGPALSSGYVAWRLPLATSQNVQAQTDDTDLAPWSAPDLKAGSAVTCRNCSSTLVESNLIHTWKDLPSDNWAEMMEFWHCHKPDVKHAGDKPDDKDAQLANRGYGANSVISAEADIGFVDLTTLLFSESDCQELLFSESTSDKASSSLDEILSSVQTVTAADTTSTVAAPRGLNVFCASCKAQIGYFTLRRQQSVHLFKWQVSLLEGDGRNGPSIADCVAATLVATIQRTGSSKSLILPIYELEGRTEDEQAEQVLQVWVLNGSIVYSASSDGGETDTQAKSARRAIKLLYKYVPRTEADAILENLNSDVQEINLPRETIGAVTDLLEKSTTLLPARDRLFKEWKIGLLERWDPKK